MRGRAGRVRGQKKRISLRRGRAGRPASPPQRVRENGKERFALPRSAQIIEHALPLPRPATKKRERLQSDGTNFKIDTKKAPKEPDSRVARFEQGTALPTMDASGKNDTTPGAESQEGKRSFSSLYILSARPRNRREERDPDRAQASSGSRADGEGRSGQAGTRAGASDGLCRAKGSVPASVQTLRGGSDAV